MSICIYKDFINNKYYRLYMKLLSVPDDASSYTEVHHILPRSLGGLDDPENLVRITARKHFLAHYLLTKFTIQNSNAWHSMIKAFNMMATKPIGSLRYINSRLYEANRKHMSSTMSVLQSGSGNSQYGTMWIYNAELKQNKKIPKDEIIPEGWVKGRCTGKYYKHNNCNYRPKCQQKYQNRKCSHCGKIGCMSSLSKFCSIECKKNNHDMLRGSILNTFNKEEFVKTYLSLESIIQTLKEFNVASAGENTKWANQVILESGNFEAICIYMRNKKRR